MPGYGFGYGYGLSRRRSFGGDGTIPAPSIQYGPRIGPRGPKQIITAVWTQAPVAYCLETNNRTEDLYARWKARGINTIKPSGHPDAVLEGQQVAVLAAAQANGLMMIAAPKWEPEYSVRPNFAPLDLRSLATTDPYWRDNWIGYQTIDEMDLAPFPLAVHQRIIAAFPIGGVTKPVFANFTRRVAIPATGGGSASINWWHALNVPEIANLGLDSYEWHLDATDANVATTPEARSGPPMWVSTWNGDGIYTAATPHTAGSMGRRFTASITGLAVHLMRNGPLSRGRSQDGGVTIEPPSSNLGTFLLPEPMTYAPGDKSYGHYIATGRVDLAGSYPRGGQWQPGRFLRNEAWSGFVHGSCCLSIFPQTVGSLTVTGYVDAAAGELVVTSAPRAVVGPALRVIAPGGEVGWIRRDAPQLSGTPRGAGRYALDPVKVSPVATGTAGAPVTLTLASEARAWGDDSNPENLAELAALIANLTRMQAHPTGGNLMMDPVQGGRRAFEVMRCPDSSGDLALFKEDMTGAPVQAGYSPGGVAIADNAGGPPQWEFGWPMGFEGFRVTGDDGAVYCYVRAMSNGNRPTWFPGFAPLGLPPRVFGPFELAGFRRVGTGAAVEMTDASGVTKAGVDDGAATWFWIESSAISQPEGNSGPTAYAITVRRGGALGPAQSVTATVSGTGIAPASAADFAGGVFPSEVLVFAASETTKVFTINVAGDAAAEQDETFAVTLSAPTGGAALVASGKSALTCTIANDDAASVGAFVWLGNSFTAAPALPGAPPSAVWLNANETSYLTRGGIRMRAVGAAFTTNASGFASMPLWGVSNAFQGAIFELDAGVWDVGVLVITDGSSGGTLSLIDNPAGAATVRYSRFFPTSATRVNDTDGTSWTDPATAVADAVNNLTFVPVTITDLGGGKGVLWARGTTPMTLLAAVGLRKLS